MVARYYGDTGDDSCVPGDQATYSSGKRVPYCDKAQPRWSAYRYSSLQFQEYIILGLTRIHSTALVCMWGMQVKNLCPRMYPLLTASCQQWVSPACCREDGFGHGLLDIHTDGKTAEWAWHSNTGSHSVSTDTFLMQRDIVACPKRAFGTPLWDFDTIVLSVLYMCMILDWQVNWLLGLTRLYEIGVEFYWFDATRTYLNIIWILRMDLFHSNKSSVAQ